MPFSRGTTPWNKGVVPYRPSSWCAYSYPPCHTLAEARTTTEKLLFCGPLFVILPYLCRNRTLVKGEL